MSPLLCKYIDLFCLKSRNIDLLTKLTLTFYGDSPGTKKSKLKTIFDKYMYNIIYKIVFMDVRSKTKYTDRVSRRIFQNVW